MSDQKKGKIMQYPANPFSIGGIVDWNDEDDSADEGDDFEFGQTKTNYTASEPKESESQQRLEEPNEEIKEPSNEQQFRQRGNRDYGKKEYRDRREKKQYGEGGYERRGGDRRHRNYGGDQGEEGGNFQKKHYDKPYNRGPRHDRQNNEHFNKEEIDPNSNYRLYYCNDPAFFIKVMEQEPAPYTFKMHAFPKNRNQCLSNEEEHKQRVDSEYAIGDILEKYGAKDIKHQKMQDGDKTRYNFFLEDKENALKLFKHLNPSQGSFSLLQGQIGLKIFYVKPGKSNQN